MSRFTVQGDLGWWVAAHGAVQDGIKGVSWGG